MLMSGLRNSKFKPHRITPHIPQDLDYYDSFPTTDWISKYVMIHIFTGPSGNQNIAIEKIAIDS